MIIRLDAPEFAAALEQARGLVFDCDGTLVSSYGRYYSAWQTAFSHENADFRADWYVSRVGLSARSLIAAFEAEIGRRIDCESVLRRLAEAMESNSEPLREIPAVAAIARAAGGKKPMAVASGGLRRTVIGSLREVGLLSLFDAIVAAEDAPLPKPAPDPFLVAASRISVEPRHCIAFEDSREGIAAALSAGMPVVDVSGLAKH